MACRSAWMGHLDRCLAQYDKRAWDKALSDCSKAIEIDPKVAQAFIKRGFVWQAKGDDEKAIADYDEAIRLDPKDAVAFVNRGIAWGPRATTTARSTTMTRRPNSIRNMLVRSTVEAALGAPRATTTARSPIMTKRSASIQNMLVRSTVRQRLADQGGQRQGDRRL